MVNISYRTTPYDHLPPNENIIRKGAVVLGCFLLTTLKVLT